MSLATLAVGDIYGAFGGKGLGAFDDLEQLTMFADYRVPVVLKTMGVLKYSPQLEAKVRAQALVGSWVLQSPDCDDSFWRRHPAAG